MDKIYELLCEMGIQKHLLGFEMAHDSIEYLIQQKSVNERVSMTQLYEEIARKHNVSPTAIERNIRTAIHKAIKKSNEEDFERWFPGYKENGLTTMEFLYSVVFMIENLADGQKFVACKPRMIEVKGGYKAFHGVMRVKNSDKEEDIEDDWIYIPEYSIWCNSQGGIHPNKCTIISIM